ncbi:hypothetical protein ACFYO2_12915 [Streptomyces sp. NPDC006602]
MPSTITEQQSEQEIDTAVELPEVTSSQLVFDHGVQSQPHICPSAAARAA